jgi:Cu+-exporting ATPase
MDVEPSSAAATCEYADDTYYFCSPKCKEKFEQDPERYVSRAESSQS